jgi:hypothetical protein
MNNTLVIYEYKAALYDVYHWIERFKDKIKSMEKDAIKDSSMDLGIIFKIKMDYDNEEITIVPFNLLKTITSYTNTHYVGGNGGFWNKIVLIGRVPVENKEIMDQLQQLLYK